MAIAPIKLPRLPANQKLMNADGTPTLIYSRWWQSVVQQVETAINGIIELPGIQEAVEQAQAAAEAANSAAAAANDAAGNAQGVADSTAAEQSIINSYVTNFAGASVLAADSTGQVTVVNHDRVYGDSTLNPTVSVIGGVIATGFTAGTTARIYYDDPMREGGGVSYQFTTDAAVATQSGSRHSVGAVEIPAAGTADGGYVQPPGYSSKVPEY